MTLPARNIPFAKLPLGKGVLGLRCVGNLPGSRVLTLLLGGAALVAIDRDFFSFTFISAHSLVTFFLSRPLRSLSRKLRLGWQLGSGGIRCGVIGLVCLGLVSAGCTDWEGTWVTMAMGGRGWIGRLSPLLKIQGSAWFGGPVPCQVVLLEFQRLLLRVSDGMQWEAPRGHLLLQEPR